jgi:predicted MFS family arabinose efflux permease
MPPARIVFSALLPFATGYFFSYLLRAVNAVVAPDLVADAGLTPAELGLLTSAYLVTFALVQLPLGVFLDRYGPRRVQSVLLTVAALGCALFALAPGFAGLFLARGIIGIGFSAGLMACYKSSSTFVPAERRAFANASIMSFGAMGVVVATEPTEWLVSLIGWRHTFQVFAGLILLAAGFIWLAAPRRDVTGEPGAIGEQVPQMLAIMKTPLFWRVAPLCALTSGVQIGIQTLWAGPWHRDVLGLSREEVARHLLWMAISFVVGILGVGIVADRLGRRGIGPMQVMLGFNIVYFLAQFVIVMQWKALVVPAWLVLAAVGQVAILSFPWFAAKVGTGLAGRSNATINFSMFVAAFATQWLVGVIIGLFPETQTGYAPEAYAWAIGLFLMLQLLAFTWYLAAPIGRRDA